MESSAGETVVMDAPVGIDDAVKGKSATNADGGLNEEVIRNETAAVEVQRMYRGHRARRNIADAATMAHKFGWWNVVEGAVLQQFSSNFYAFNTPQTAAQRWLRLKKKAAKVGKGLSKNDNARKLALQHWLEAIDPKHRYGHNLHFYYEVWGNSQTQEPFFYWLDIGEGKNVDLEKCTRSKLQKELITYMSPKERKWFEVVVENGKLMNKITGESVNTPKGEKWIFVMSTTCQLYVGKKEKGKIQHSSFLAGGATTAAGRLLVKNGTIEVFGKIDSFAEALPILSGSMASEWSSPPQEYPAAIDELMEAHSGHYRPTPEDFEELVRILMSSGADLTMARVQAVSDDMLSVKSNSAKSLGVNSETADIPVGLEGVQKQDFNNDDASARELASLNFNDQQSPSGAVDEKTLLEKTLTPKAQDKDDKVIEGLEFLQMGGSFDGSGIWENLEGMKVEIIKPGKISQLEIQISDDQEGNTSGKDATTKSSSKVPQTSVSHKLFAPALQTFSKLEDRADSCSTDRQDAKTKTLLN